MATLAEINSMARGLAEAELMRCCGSRQWAEKVAAGRPFMTREALFESAREIWFVLEKNDWLEAFSHHPRIGERQLREKFASTAQWAEQEQKGANSASESVLQALASGNAEYERRFGRVFLVCATGKSADEMLKLLEQRLPNDPELELMIAVGEQAKITQIRLEKWLNA